MNTARDRYRIARFGRPSASISRAELLALGGATWVPAHPAHIRQRKPARQFGSLTASWEHHLSPFPESGISVIPNGKLLGYRGWAFSEDGRMLRDDSWWGDRFDDAQLPTHFPSLTSLGGIVLNLTSDWTNYNYGHLLLDGLSRLAIFEKAGFDLRHVDFIYTNRPESETHRKILDRLSIPISKCIWSGDHPFVQAETLLEPSHPATHEGNYPHWVPEFLRRVGEPSSKPWRRVYLQRKNMRRIANEDRLLPILERADFELYDFRSQNYEPAYFADAAVIVGAHGAALTNLTFSKEGTKVLELVPSDHVKPYYYTLAESGGQNYAYLMGQSLETRPPEAFGASEVDFVIDPDEFESALYSILAELRT